MRGTIACISFLLLNATPITTAPATAGASTNSGTSIVQINNAIPSMRNATKGPPGSFCSRSNMNADVQKHMINVPSTTTILTIYYCPGITLPRDTIGRTIDAVAAHMTDQIRALGDRALLPTDDPYTSPADVDCTMSIYTLRTRTAPTPYHLTYQITLNALEGLFKFLYADGHYASAVTEIADPGLTGTFQGIGLISISPTERSVDES